jgi:hypothetical protein
MKNVLRLKGKYLITFLIVFFACLFLFEGKNKKAAIPDGEVLKSAKFEEIFTLETGDLIVRPNINYLPGTCSVDSGRNFGHVAVIVQGSEGKTLEEALKKAWVIESFIFDQASRKFVFNSGKQVRKVSAIIPFGHRFAGIRYRLRTTLSQEQKEKMLEFLYLQIAKHGYSLFSSKGENLLSDSLNNSYASFGGKDWNCATLGWFAYKYAAGIDIDSNGGIIVYPNDCICSKFFDIPDGRIRF